MKQKFLASILILAIIRSIYFIVTKIAVDNLSVIELGISMRLVMFVIFIIVLYRKKELGLVFKTKGVLGRLIIIGIFGFLIDFTNFWGLKLSTASNGSILVRADILFTNIASIIIFKKRFTIYDWIYSTGMLAGIFLVLDINIINFSFNGWGDILFILSALFLCINGFIIKNVQCDEKNPQKGTVVAFYNVIVTTVLFAALFVIETDKTAFLEFRQNFGHVFVPLFFSGLLQVLCYLLYYYNLKNLQVWIVKISLLIIPVITTAMSFFFLSESVNLNQLMGMIIVVAGCAGIIYEQRRKKHIRS